MRPASSLSKTLLSRRSRSEIVTSHRHQSLPGIVRASDGKHTCRYTGLHWHPRELPRCATVGTDADMSTRVVIGKMDSTQSDDDAAWIYETEIRSAGREASDTSCNLRELR